MNEARVVALLVSLLAVACSSDQNRAQEPTKDASAPPDASPIGTHDGSPNEGDAQATSSPVVELKSGKVQGDVDRGTRRFRGIPYAKAPIGDLRWKPPAPVEAWTGVLPALDFKSECAQPAWIQGPESDSEDCLYLNVWAPEATPGKPLPVMVWLPGGGNQNGGASDNSPLIGGELLYDGRNLASHDVVVVTINYRLGVFGFFSHPGLTAEGSASGNQGLLDQQAALAWVHDNIAAFGGDPKNVTLFGESAGSQDTCLQVVAPGGKGLFHRAISESGGCTTYRKTKAEAEAQITAFAEALGCSGSSGQLACLRGKSVKDLLIAAPVDGLPDSGADLAGGSRFSGGTARWDFNPVVDGTVIPDQPRALADAGQFAKVPYILGSNFEEGRLFLLGAAAVDTDADYEAALDRLFGASAPTVLKTYPATDFPTRLDALVRIWGDFRLGCPTYESAQRFAKQGASIYMYHFSRTTPGLEALGPTHGTEMPYVFGTLAKPGSDDAALSDTMQGYWTRFAKAGDPNGASASTWPPFVDSSDKSMGFDVPPAVLTGFRRKECDMWESLYDADFNN